MFKTFKLVETIMLMVWISVTPGVAVVGLLLRINCSVSLLPLWPYSVRRLDVRLQRQNVTWRGLRVWVVTLIRWGYLVTPCVSVSLVGRLSFDRLVFVKVVLETLMFTLVVWCRIERAWVSVHRIH